VFYTQAISKEKSGARSGAYDLIYMEHDDGLFGAKHEFIAWLKTNNLHSYQAALEEEG
jgi:hypothetical protein